MSEPGSAIEVKNLYKAFRAGRDTVLEGVNLKFPQGKLTYILGPSGTGKSVLVKHILGLLQPDQGEIFVNGKSLSLLKGDALREHRLQFGMLFQNSALFDDMTIFQNVAFPLMEQTNLPGAEIRNQVIASLKHLGIESGLDKYPNELSGGMRKRVGLARAIIRKPSILLYDEPTTGLDPVTRSTVDDLIAHLKESLRLTSIVISHDIPSALLNADFIAFLYQGKVVYEGDAKNFVRSQHPMIRSFLDAESRSSNVLRAQGI